MIGKKISHYQILEKLGEGGMGVVYQAEDTKLGRFAALKFLPSHLSADEEVKQRFITEAKAASALDHPNICTVHEIDETDDGQMFIAMAYYDGETLRERMKRKPLSLVKATKIAIQIAQGLAKAHEQGIIHRDVKPANIMIRKDGLVKILDFGLAKMADAHITRTGWTLGTAAYMSPEQARGEEVDHRSDIWSLGVIIYEMTTGQYPFEGEHPQAIIYSILSEDPAPPCSIQENIPTALETIIMRCFEKDREQRFSQMDEVGNELEKVLLEISGQESSPTSISEIGLPRKSKARLVWWEVLSCVFVLLVFISLQLYRMARQSEEIKPGKRTQLTHSPALEIDPTISPDGKMLAYSAGTESQMDIYVRQISGGRAIALISGVPGNHFYPKWSPDGSEIAFHSANKIYTVPALGGTPKPLIEKAGGFGLSWSPDGKEIVHVWDNIIYIQPVDGSKPKKIAEIFDPHSFCFSPDGSRLAYVAGNSNFVFGAILGNIAPSSMWVVSLPSGKPVQLRESKYLNMSPVWMPDGKRLLFVSDQDGSPDVYLMSLDDSGKSLGHPVRLTTGLDAHTIDMSSDGKFLAYSKFTHKSNIWSIRIPEGETISASEAQPVTIGNQVIEDLQVSKDRQWLAYDSNLRGNQDIYKILITGGEPMQLTTHPRNDYHPTWSPDGKEIAFYSLREGNRDIFVMSSDGGSLKQITYDPADEIQPYWSPDGKQLVFYSSKTGNEELYIVSKKNGDWGTPSRLTHDGGEQGRWSPKDQLIAYKQGGNIKILSPEDGDTRMVFDYSNLKDFPHPRYITWSSDGEKIYYKAVDKEGISNFWSIPISGGTPKLLVRFDDPSQKFNRTEFTADGKNFFFTLAENESDIWLMELNTE